MSNSKERKTRRRTVFISSRMEELATERRACFDAVYALGFTPLMFEMEPISDLREQIDGLVDNTDIFVGIYYQTIGQNNENLFNLTPIEYELYRFLIAETLPPEWQDKKEERKVEIVRRLECEVEPLKRRIRAECCRREGSLYEVLKKKVLLFRRLQEEDHHVSRRLTDFLQLFEKDDFKAEKVEGTELIDEERYLPPHTVLFKKVHERLRSETDYPSSPVVAENNRVLSIKVTGDDKGGLLYKVVRQCFRDGLNIVHLRIDRNPQDRPGASQQVVIELSAESYHNVGGNIGAIGNVVVGKLQQELGKDFEIIHTVGPLNNAVDRARDPQGEFMYTIRGADVPGTFMAIAGLIARSGGNVDYVDYQPPADTNSQVIDRNLPNSAPYRSGNIGVSPIPGESLSTTPYGAIQLQYELRSLIGIVDVDLKRREKGIRLESPAETHPPTSQSN